MYIRDERLVKINLKINWICFKNKGFWGVPDYGGGRAVCGVRGCLGQAEGVRGRAGDKHLDTHRLNLCEDRVEKSVV